MKEQQTPKKQNILVRLLALLVTAALMLGALFLVANRDKYNLDALKRWMAQRDVQTGENGQAEPLTHSGGEGSSFALLSDGVLMTSKAGIHYYDFSGEQYAEQVVTMEHPVLTASSTAGVAYDAGGQSVSVYKNGQEAFALTLEGDADVLSARINENGFLAVTAQESGYKGAVTVYNSSFERVFRLNRSSTFVVDAAVSPDNKTAAVVTMGQSGGSFESALLIHPLDKEEELARVSLGNAAVLDLDYENGQIWVLCEDCLQVVSTEDWSVKSYSFDSSYLKGCSLGGDGFALVLLGRYRAGSAERVVTVGADGRELARMALQGQNLAYDAAGRYLCLLSGSELGIYTQDLVTYRALQETKGARFAAMSATGTVLLADRQQAWLYIPD